MEEIHMAKRKITIEYCSNYNSYNGEPVTPGNALAPFIISDEHPELCPGRCLLGLDTHEDEAGNEIGPDVADPHANTEESAILSVLFAELMDYLEKENSRYATMVRLGSAGYSKEEIFKAVGLKSTFGYQEWNRAKKMVKDFLDV
jgi:hypothetical protein